MSLDDVSVYDYRPLPWLSKSHISGYKFCQHLFKLRYIDKIDTGSTEKMETGTNIHMVYAKFFEILDYAKLHKIPIDYIEPLEKTRIYAIIYDTIMSLIPVPSRGYEPYEIMVRNLALIETDHWIELNRKYKEVYSTVIKFFIPKILEKYYECNCLKIFGTIDRGDMYEEDEDITIIYDYKTGKVPIAITEEREYDPSNPFSWKLSSKRSFELHWYIVLDMCRKGYKIDQKLIDFCTKPEFFHEDAELPDVESIFYDKNGVPVDFRELYRIGIIYTGDKDRPYIPKKNPHIQSMRSIFKWINKMRTILLNKGPFNKKPNYWKCKECNENIMKQCLTEEENKMIFWSEEETT